MVATDGDRVVATLVGATDKQSANAAFAHFGEWMGADIAHQSVTLETRVFNRSRHGLAGREFVTICLDHAVVAAVVAAAGVQWKQRGLCASGTTPFLPLSALAKEDQI